MTEHRFAPNWTVPPGEILADALADRGMTQADLARRLARPLKTISEITTGKAALTAETAIQLERALGISASLWTALEARYREALARRSAHVELRTYSTWAKGFPLKALRSVQALPGSNDDDAVGPLLTFLGVANPEGWERRWAQDATNYRIGSREPEREAMTAWLRLGELAIEGVKLESRFNRRRLRIELEAIRGLSREAVFAFAIEETRARLAAAGTVFIVVPELPGAPVSGAVRWLRKDLPLVQLSLRYLSDDQFWYSLYHECGHLLGARKVDVVEDVIEGTEGADEGEADGFARDALLPMADFGAFADTGNFSKAAIRAFAARVGVSPGIVVGRLHRDRRVPWERMNDLRRFYPTPKWSLPDARAQAASRIKRVNAT